MFQQILFRLAQHFLFAGTTFFFGIGMGPSKAETTEQSALGSLAGFATGEGESDTLTSDNFWKSILSGDPTQISKVLGPEISAINKQSQQEKKTTSEFGNRGGGTNAFMQTIGDKTRTGVNDIISSLVGNGASALGASGSSLLSAGLSAHEVAFSEANTIQQQKEAQLGDIFKSITSIASSFLGSASAPSGGDPGSVLFGQAGGGAGNGPGGVPLESAPIPDAIPFG